MVFEVSGTYTPETVPIAGLWQAEPMPSMPEAVSFGLPVVEDVTVWRANLPAFLPSALSELETGNKAVEKAQKQLSVAEKKLERLIQEDAVSFGITDWLGDKWKEIAPKMQEIMNRMTRVLRQAVQIETKIGNVFVGKTLVSWGGDFDTIWLSNVSDAQMETHYRTLSLALDSHKTYLRRLELVVRSVIRLAMALTAPGAALVSLPKSWQLVNEIIDEFTDEK